MLAARVTTIVVSGALAFALAPLAQAQDLLRGKSPVRSDGVKRAGALTDGFAAQDGGDWNTRLSARFTDTHASATFDLGAVERVRAAWLQGDRDDTYRLEGSRDGRSFTVLWDAPPVDAPGMQPRFTERLDAEARYIRVRPVAGDGFFAVAEVQLGTGQQALQPPAARRATSLSERMRDKTLLFGVGLLALLFVPARPRRYQLLAGLALAAAGSVWFATGVWDAWQAGTREVALLRGVIAFVGAVAVLRAALSPPRWPGHRAICVGVLGVCALLGVGAFYNLGHPQFYNPHQGRWTFPHLHDLRQYYGTAKYFRELSYFRIYDADLAAYAEEVPERTWREVQELPVRDLHSFEAGAIAERRASIETVRQQFTPERWAGYKADAAWFREALGARTWFDTFLDYGGNATPVWMATAHVLFSLVPPSEAAFTWTGLLDLALMLGAFLAIARTFGATRMFVCALVWGATDFVMYGSNWAGSTLRHDWLALLGLGVCALARDRWLLGGALLGLATMIRAFPALALFGIGVPLLLRAAEDLVRTRRLPPFRELVARERATLRIALGALATALGTAMLSLVVLGGFDAWPEWWAKVSKIDSDPHPACVALRNLIAGTDGQARLLRARWPLYTGLIVLYTGAIALLCRNARPERAAVLGTCLVPVLLYPANYYLHLVYLWPLVAAAARSVEPEPREVWVWFVLLMMCAAQYFTTLEPDVTLHFYLSTVTLFAALTAMLSVLIAHTPSVRAWLLQPRGGAGV